MDDSIIAVSGFQQHPFDTFATSANACWLRDKQPSNVAQARFLLYGPAIELDVGQGLIESQAITFLTRLTELSRPSTVSFLATETQNCADCTSARYSSYRTWSRMLNHRTSSDYGSTIS